MNRFLTSLVLAVFVLAINPMVACQNEEAAFTFGESEMRSAATGDYSGTVLPNGETIDLTLEQSVSAGTKSAQSFKRIQCASRNFIQTAAACSISSTMALTAHVSSSHPLIPEGDLTGTFIVDDLDLTRGILDLNSADGARVYATYDAAKGGFVDWTYTGSSGQLELQLTRLGNP